MVQLLIWKDFLGKYVATAKLHNGKILTSPPYDTQEESALFLKGVWDEQRSLGRPDEACY